MTEISPQQTVTPPNPKINWKNILIVSILVSVLVIGGIVAYAAFQSRQTKTPAVTIQKGETANWKTYADISGYYVLKYEPTYQIENPEKTSIYLKSQDYTATKPATIFPISGSIIVVTAQKININIDQYETTLIEENKKLNKKNISIDGQNFRSFENINGQNRSRIVFTMKNDILYVLSIESPIKDFDAANEVFEKILSTFRFPPEQ